MRQLHEHFLNELISGRLASLLEYIKGDAELDIQIRKNYINVYYKGGNILKINSPKSFDFDKMYFNDYRTISSTEAKKSFDLIHKYKEQQKSLKSLLPHNPQEYIKQAKKAMDKWDVALKDVVQHNEKKEQQAIAIANRADTDYVVLDLEYAVSKQSEFAYDGGDDKKVPRFDIIAIRNGRLFVIELKKGLGATYGKSGIESHMKCYNHTIGREYKHFVKEMQALLKQKQELGLLDKTLTIEDTKPEFIFAFADKKDKDDFEEFAKRCFDVGYEGNFIYIGNDHKLTAKKSRKYYYYYAERRKQKALYNDKFWGNTPNGGHWTIFKNGRKIKVVENLPYILHQNYSKENLCVDIREDAILYFKQNKISWWRQQEDNYSPTGHLVSSQIHCLNHLMAIQRDKKAVLAIIKSQCPTIVDVLPSPIDSNVEVRDGKLHRFNSYITFEFTCDNRNLLHESGDKRGKKCTSVDALVYAKDKNKGNVLIPIEWKYTESYEKTPKERAHQESVKRYVDLANLKSSNLKEWILDYEWNPLYEFARQELLMEQIIKEKPLCGFGFEKKPLEANDFIHIIVRPDENAEIREDIAAFRKTIVEKSKFIEVDPQMLLAPLQQFEEYSDLLTYLQTRYWKK